MAETEIMENVPSPEQVLVEMNEKMCSKEERDEWKNKYYKLFKDVANGSVTPEQEHKTEAQINQEFGELVDGYSSHKIRGSLESAKGLLKLDDYQVSHGLRSCFVASIGDLDDAMIESGKRVRATLEEAIEHANGSDEVFSAYLGNLLSDAK